jgi:hypothetical protein
LYRKLYEFNEASNTWDHSALKPPDRYDFTLPVVGVEYSNKLKPYISNQSLVPAHSFAGAALTVCTIGRIFHSAIIAWRELQDSVNVTARRRIVALPELIEPGT